MDAVQYMTETGAKKLEIRLTYLRAERLPQLIEQLHGILIDGGGFSESSEFANIKSDQAMMEAEVERLELLLRSAKIIDSSRNQHQMRFGAWVTVLEKGDQEEENYQLVSSAEANPGEGLISTESPLGTALLAAKLGELIKVEVPDGELIFLIKAIR